MIKMIVSRYQTKQNQEPITEKMEALHRKIRQIFKIVFQTLFSSLRKKKIVYNILRKVGKRYVI